MKTIIAGSREITDFNYIVNAIKESKFNITTIISGTARGVDKLGEQYGIEHNIPIIRFPADWEKYGKSAGYKRNELMASQADALIAIWDGISNGTKHMIDIAKRKKLNIYVYFVHKEIKNDIIQK